MANNIENINVLTIYASINSNDIILLSKCHDALAEDNFIHNLLDKAEEFPNQDITILKLNWFGEWSGNGFDFFLNSIVPKIKGYIEVIFTFESGDSEGYIINDGTYKECNIEYKLTPKD